jgi:glycine cleavage system H lipoate-binding protein/ABC-type phosphate transport system substrate-binding protein
MKIKILFFTIMLLSYANNQISSATTVTANSSKGDSISVICSPDLLNLTLTWAREYNKVNSGVKIMVNSTGPENVDFTSKGSFGFVSNEFYSTINNKESAWKIVVGRDVIVPVINSKNPFSKEIYQKGISAAEIARLFINPEKQVWGTLLGNNQSQPVKFYLIDNESLKSDIAGFLNTNQTMIEGIKVKNGKELVKEVQKDPYAIGFCKLIDIVDFNNQLIFENIGLLPIDRNGNGEIDYSEKIYTNLNEFTRGIWIGKYPRTLFNNIYSVANAQPVNQNELAFLKWVLTDGQGFINPNGYIDLTVSERQAKIDKLIPANIEMARAENNYANLVTALLILAILMVAGFIIVTFIRTGKFKRATVIHVNPIIRHTFNEYSVGHLNGLYFDKTHTWVFMEKDGNVTIGIDDFIQHVTGSITQLKLKNPGEKVKKGEPVLSLIQQGKQLNINAPISGIIREQNQKLIKNPSLINTSPYDDGWIYTIEPLNWLREIQFLFMTNNYRKWLKNEFSRLKDFMSIFIKPGTVEYSNVILQDGGELKDNLLSDFGPEVWEEFQNNFIDISK